jgi:hypothetical protein
VTTPAPAALDPISTLVDGSDLAARVESLLTNRPALVVSRRVLWPGMATLAAVAVAYAPALRAVHEITEILVNSLP